MKKILLIGKTGCGKTTLMQRINGRRNQIQKKPRDDKRGGRRVRHSGEYLENKSMYTETLIVSSYECDVIGLLLAKNDTESMFPPSFRQHLRSQ